MAEETHYRANTGVIAISTRNTGLDGTGTLGTVLTAGANGTLIKSITIKAQESTTRGMIRFFIYNGDITLLLFEVDVPPITKSSTNPTFQITIPINLTMQPEYSLMVSTENAQIFNIIAEGMDWSYYAASVRTDTTSYIANTGIGLISTANSNLDGSGTTALIYSPGGSTTYKGSSIGTIDIKSIVNATSGMVRIFIFNGDVKFLFKEIQVNTVTKSGMDESFAQVVSFEEDFDLHADYALYASTENSESFVLTVQGGDYKYSA